VEPWAKQLPFIRTTFCNLPNLTLLILWPAGLFSAANGSEEQHSLSFRELAQDSNVNEARSIVDSQDFGMCKRNTMP
jgi:hypothetical protein